MPPWLRGLLHRERVQQEGQKFGEAPTGSDSGFRWGLLLESRYCYEPSPLPLALQGPVWLIHVHHRF